MAGSQGRPSLEGLKGLYRLHSYPIPEENILSRSGGPADPRHGQDQSGNPPYLTGPYPNQAGTQGAYGPTGIEDGFMDNWALTEGHYDPDQSPMTHGGPFPAHGATFGELRNGEAQWADQRSGMAAHAADFGASQEYKHPRAHDWQGASFHHPYAESGGTTVSDGLVVPKFILTGEGGGRDREVLGNGGNPVFHVGHIDNMRQQGDGVPYNIQWLDASQRIFQVKTTGAKNTFDGPDSPYGAAGDETTNMMHAPDQAAVMTDATAYRAPADPNVAPPYTPNDSWAW